MTRGGAWLLACLIVGSFAAWQSFRPMAPQVELPVLHTLGGDFTLDSTLGRPLSLSELQGALVLLNFGFTGCPDVCPTALARMRDTILAVDASPRQLQPLFVTLDPEADTVERMAPYVNFFHPDLVGLTGTEEAIAAAAAPFKVFYERAELDGSGGYTINHSSHIYLIDARGRVRATFGENVPVQNMTDAVLQLLAEAELAADQDAEGTAAMAAEPEADVLMREAA